MISEIHQDTHQRTPRPRLTIAAPQAMPEAPWEGHFRAKFRSGGDYGVPVKLGLRIYDTMIEGKGRSLTYPTKVSDEDRKFDISGTRHLMKVKFEFWFAGKTIAHRPWCCEGRLCVGQQTITGEWHMQCLDVTGCDCGGPSGPFELKKCR
jgi:hypothetical protein